MYTQAGIPAAERNTGSAQGLLSCIFGIACLLSPISISAAEPTRVFTLESNPSRISALDPSGNPLYGIELTPRGMGRTDRLGALVVHRGHFEVKRAGAVWARTLAAGRGFTIEITGTFASPNAIGTLLSLESAGAPPRLRIAQESGEVFAEFSPAGNAAPTRVPLAKSGAAPKFRLTLAYDGKQLLGYADGADPVAIDASLDFKDLDEPEFVLGGMLDGSNDWEGTLTSVALFDAPIDAATAAEHFRATRERDEAAAAVEQLVVDAVLVGTSPVPTLAQLAPYTQSLAVYEYEVKAVRAGKYDVDRLYVAHWSILDNIRLPFADLAPGGHYTLLLEPFADQPQLQSENLSDSVIEDFSRPLFYDAGGLSLGIDAAKSRSENPSSAPSAVAQNSAVKAMALARDEVKQARLLDIAAAKERLVAQEVRAGGYTAWNESLAPFRDAIRLNAASHDRIAIVGLEKHVFSRSGVSYLLDTDLIEMPGARAPALDVILGFNRQLNSQGIDLIFVPVPAREEVYPDKLSTTSPSHLMVSPQMTQYLKALLDGGVEVVDLRDVFLEERTKHDELLYTIADMHWGSDGIRRAAAEIAPRLRRYGLESSQPRMEYTEKSIRIAREGGSVRYLPENAKPDYPLEQWNVSQVIDQDGQVYKDTEASPVLVLGDSFTMRYSGEGGHLSAHLAREMGFPVTTLSTKGGGPKVPRLLASQGADYVASRRAIVWVMASHYLGDAHAPDWETLPPSALEQARSRDLAAAKDSLAAQVSGAGGYAAWDESLTPFRDEVRMNSGAHTRYTIAGLDRHLFARSGTDYLLDTDLIAMPAAPTPEYPAPARAFDAIVEFNRQLRGRGIDLIYVPVPAREEVYPDKLSAAAPPSQLVSPQLTRFMEALIEADVETLDLREAFLDERGKHDELLYPISEVHWGAYGIRRAAAEIAARIRRYGFDQVLPRVEYTERTRRITRQGNLVSSLPESAKADYPSFEQDLVQVINPDGTAYRDTENSPVVVAGDSFTMWFAEEGAGLSAHLARELQYPVTSAPSKGGGPRVPRMLASKGAEYFEARKVVVWVMVSRYLSDQNAQFWEAPPTLP